MKKQHLFLALTLITLTLFSCKTPKEFIDGLKVTPSPMEEHAGKVVVDIEGTYPEKYFTKKLELIVTPVLKTKSGEVIAKSASKTYQGEKVEGNGTTVNYKVGGKYSQTATFDYTDAMRYCDLWLQITAKVGKKEYTMPDEKIGEGVDVTPLLVSFEPATGNLKALILPDNFQRVIEEKTDAEIKYLIQQSNIRTSQLKSESVVALTKAIKGAQGDSTRELKNMEISSYASPDGPMTLNENLADSRSKASEKYVNRELKKFKASLDVNSKFTAEDWAGFQKLMEESNIQDKEVILRVLKMYSDDPDKREAEIKNLAAAYKTIADEILPQLRRSKMTLTIDVIGKSDDEISKLAATAPDSLNVEELLYAATLTDNLSEKESIYKKATELYSNDARTFNNLGMVQYEEGNLDGAKTAFAKALSLDSKNPQINYNNGLVALADGNVDKAKEYFGNAGGVGDALNYANGAIDIKEGKYADAVKAFGSDKSNNAALANILNKNYSAARSILDNVETPNNTTTYLKAVLAAKTNDSTSVVSNLVALVKADSSYKNTIATDVVFTNYLSNEVLAAALK